MRILSLIAVVLFVSSLTAPARAGMEEDCYKDASTDQRISGCTAIIRSGQYSGKHLARAYYNRGLMYASRGEYQRAIEDYDETLGMNSGIAEVHRSRGDAYSRLGDFARAIESYGQVVLLTPTSTAFHRLAWAYYRMGNNTKARSLMYTTTTLGGGDDGQAINTLAHIKAALGQPVEALGEFEHAMQVGGEAYVLAYQTALAKHGYYRGEIDGSYGPQTRAALVACLEAGCRLLE